MVHRPFIRKAINYVFYRFVFETEHHNGIAGGLVGGLMRRVEGTAVGAALNAWRWYPRFPCLALVPSRPIAGRLFGSIPCRCQPAPTFTHVHPRSPTLTPCFARRAAGDPGVHHQRLCAAAQGGAQAVPAGGLVGLDLTSGLALLEQMLPMPVVLLVIKRRSTRNSCMWPRQAGEGGQTTGEVVGSCCRACRHTAGCRPAAVLRSWHRRTGHATACCWWLGPDTRCPMPARPPQRALMPLHKPKCLPAYHQQLSYCVTQVGAGA